MKTEKLEQKKISQKKNANELLWVHSCNPRLFDTCFGKHGRQQFTHYGSPLPHLALFAIRKIRDDSDNVFGAGSLQCICHD